MLPFRSHIVTGVIAVLCHTQALADIKRAFGTPQAAETFRITNDRLASVQAAIVSFDNYAHARNWVSSFAVYIQDATYVAADGNIRFYHGIPGYDLRERTIVFWPLDNSYYKLEFNDLPQRLIVYERNAICGNRCDFRDLPAGARAGVDPRILVNRDELAPAECRTQVGRYITTRNVDPVNAFVLDRQVLDYFNTADRRNLYSHLRIYYFEDGDHHRYAAIAPVNRGNGRVNWADAWQQGPSSMCPKNCD